MEILFFIFVYLGGLILSKWISLKFFIKEDMKLNHKAWRGLTFLTLWILTPLIILFILILILGYLIDNLVFDIFEGE